MHVCIYTPVYLTLYIHIPFFLSNDGACVYGTHTVYKSVYWTRTVFKYVSGTHPVYRYVPSNVQEALQIPKTAILKKLLDLALNYRYNLNSFEVNSTHP